MSDALVLDASMAFAWILPSQASAAAEALLERVEEGDEVVVPPLWFLEVANGLLVFAGQSVSAVSPPGVG